MDNGTDVWVLGGYQSDFARNLRREGLDFADLRAGHYDCALVVGAELEKTVPSDEAAAHLGAAAWIGQVR